MHVRLLGHVEASVDGRRIAIGAGKPRALLALLALNAGSAVSSERLLDGLWGERPPATAAKMLQVYVSRLRKVLAAAGDGTEIVTHPHGYELRLRRGDVDARRFEALIARAAPRDALALWRGPPLDDVDAEPFAAAEIRRLEELRLAALELAVEQDLAAGRHRQVIAELEALVGEEPLRERLHAQRMLALYRAGRQSDALEAYRAARAVLVEQVGIEPGPELRRLHDAILQQDPALEYGEAGRGPPAADAAIDAARRAAGETPRGAFVGRERELAALIACLDDALAGRGRLVLLVGEPGIGKSRLAEEVAAEAQSRGARVLVGRCWEAGGAPAYWPWVQSLRAYVRDCETPVLRAQLGAGGADLAQILPELRERLPDLPEPPAGEPETARFRLFEAAAGFVRAASASRAVVLVLDDLHAADTPSLLLLRFLARELAGARVLLVGACRDVDPTPGRPLTELLSDVAREPAARRLSLGGLSERELAEYVELTARQIASPELAAALHEETEGNPLFAGEIVRLLAVEGVWSRSGAQTPFAIPETVRDVISRRLAHLSEPCRRALAHASVLGREPAIDALARMAGLGDGELLDVLDEAMAARVIADVPGVPGRVRFAHALIRDTLYDGLTGARRVRLHRRALEVLEALYGPDLSPRLAELAHHALAGSDVAEGVRYARLAGDRALALLAYEEAARLYESALAALGDSGEGSRCELLLALGEARSQAGDTSSAKRALLAAAGIARRLGLAHALARAAAEYGGRIIYARAGDDERVLPLLEEALLGLAGEDAELRVRLLARLAAALRDEPSRTRRDALSRDAVELARRIDDPAALAYALDGRAISVLAPDTVAEVEALGAELRDLATRIGDRERIVHGCMHRLGPLLMLGKVAEAEAEIEVADRVARELRQPAHLWDVGGAKAMLALAEGRLGDAEGLMSDLRALGERAQPEMAIPVHLVQRYTLCDFRGGLEDVEPVMRALAAERPARPVFRCVLAHVHARVGRLPEARRALDDLTRDDCAGLPFDQEWLFGMSLLAETSGLLGDAGSATVLYRLLLPWSALNVVDQCEGIRGSVSRYLGILAPAAGRGREADRHFEDALAMNAETGALPWLARTRNDYARMRLARDGPGDRERARELLDASLGGYRELGMEPTAAGG